MSHICDILYFATTNSSPLLFLDNFMSAFLDLLFDVHLHKVKRSELSQVRGLDFSALQICVYFNTGSLPPR